MPLNTNSFKDRLATGLLAVCLTPALFFSMTGTVGGAVVNIVVNYTGDAAYESYFTSAETYWESILVNYRDGIPALDPEITAEVEYIDGSGGVLGSAGPTLGQWQSGFLLTTAGSMTFDSADFDNMIANGSLTDVIRHEMAHVLGFGTLWGYNNVYTTDSGQYTGAAALTTYKTEYNQPGATFVPVELEGGTGTANGHWNEVNGGAGNVGIASADGDIRYELMTGWLNTPTYLSDTTIAQFYDIGYETILFGSGASAVPEPTTFMLVLAGILVLRLQRKKRWKT